MGLPAIIGYHAVYEVKGGPEKLAVRARFGDYMSREEVLQEATALVGGAANVGELVTKLRAQAPIGYEVVKEFHESEVDGELGWGEQL